MLPMDFRLRAAATRAGYPVYQALQARFGLHCKEHFIVKKLRQQVAFARCAKSHGVGVVGATLVEVGTGWVPLLPLGFWMSGAEAVHSYDLNSHFLPEVFQRALLLLSEREGLVQELWGDQVSQEELAFRLSLVRAHADNPERFLQAAKIHLHAPADAAASGLARASVDLHYSTNVLEHVPSAVLRTVLEEGRRVVRPGGLLLHFIDMSDHFSHTDNKIHSANFLRYGEEAWRMLSHNRLAYHNRLREPQFRSLFEESGLRILEAERTVDERALAEIRAGFPIAPAYADLSVDELACSEVRYACRVA